MTRSEPSAGGESPGRRLHAFTLLFESIGVARAFLGPAVIGAFGAPGDDAGATLGVGLAILTVPALLAAIGKYALFRYRVQPDELVLDSGVLSRRRRVIPFRRIQNIDFRQSVLERLCGVAELRIETAGSKRTEAVLSVLAAEEAATLREELLARRRGARHEELAAEPAAEPATQVLARLSIARLALAGATANEIGLVVAGLAGVLQFAEELVPVAIPALRIDPDALTPAASGFALVLLAAGAVLLLLIAGWILSIAGAIIGYFGFTLERAGDELHKRYGLLARREGSLPLRRVQAVRIEESILRRPLGLSAVRIETAGAAPGESRRGGAEAFVPLVERRDAAALLARILGDFDLDAIRYRPVHPRARRRIFTRYALVLGAAAAVALVLTREPAWLALLGLLAPAWLLADREYRHRGYARAGGYFVARDGLLNRITWIVPEHKIQTMHVRASPLQRRHGLATLIADTAGGGRSEARVVDLSHTDAHALLYALAAPRAS